jgi:hypothetical protein
MPSFVESLFPLSAKVMKMNKTISMNIALVKNIRSLALIGYIKLVTPRTRVELTTTAPIISPKAISLCLARTALAPNVSSGSEVPMATTPIPTRIGGRSQSVEIARPSLTTKSALIKSATMLTAKIPKLLSAALTFGNSSVMDIVS